MFFKIAVLKNFAKIHKKIPVPSWIPLWRCHLLLISVMCLLGIETAKKMKFSIEGDLGPKS